MRVSFDDLPLAKYYEIRARIRALAFEVRCDGNSGSATQNGVTIEWKYDEALQSLVFTCDKRPWWVTESLAASRIRDLVEAV